MAKSNTRVTTPRASTPKPSTPKPSTLKPSTPSVSAQRDEDGMIDNKVVSKLVKKQIIPLVDAEPEPISEDVTDKKVQNIINPSIIEHVGGVTKYRSVIKERQADAVKSKLPVRNVSNKLDINQSVIGQIREIPGSRLKILRSIRNSTEKEKQVEENEFNKNFNVFLKSDDVNKTQQKLKNLSSEEKKVENKNLKSDLQNVFKHSNTISTNSEVEPTKRPMSSGKTLLEENSVQRTAEVGKVIRPVLKTGNKNVNEMWKPVSERLDKNQPKIEDISLEDKTKSENKNLNVNLEDVHEQFTTIFTVDEVGLIKQPSPSNRKQLKEESLIKSTDVVTGIKPVLKTGNKNVNNILKSGDEQFSKTQQKLKNLSSEEKKIESENRNLKTDLQNVLKQPNTISTVSRIEPASRPVSSGKKAFEENSVQKTAEVGKVIKPVLKTANKNIKTLEVKTISENTNLNMNLQDVPGQSTTTFIVDEVGLTKQLNTTNRKPIKEDSLIKSTDVVTVIKPDLKTGNKNVNDILKSGDEHFSKTQQKLKNVFSEEKKVASENKNLKTDLQNVFNSSNTIPTERVVQSIKRPVSSEKSQLEKNAPNSGSHFNSITTDHKVELSARSTDVHEKKLEGDIPNKSTKVEKLGVNTVKRSGGLPVKCKIKSNLKKRDHMKRPVFHKKLKASAPMTDFVELPTVEIFKRPKNQTLETAHKFENKIGNNLNINNESSGNTSDNVGCKEKINRVKKKHITGTKRSGINKAKANIKRNDESITVIRQLSNAHVIKKDQQEKKVFQCFSTETYTIPYKNFSSTERENVRFKTVRAKPVSELFPDGLYPVGEETNYSKQQDDRTAKDRFTSEETRVLERLYLNIYNDARRAAEAHRQTRQYIQKWVKPGVMLIKLSEKIEKRASIAVGAEGLSAGLAFPAGTNRNNCAAHYTPNPGDKSVLNYNDIIKIDFGTHVNGYIIDCAWTLAFDPKYDKLIEAVREATNAGIRAAGIDVRLFEVGSVIREVMESYEVELDGKIFNVRPIRSLNGHSIKPYRIHGGKIIPVSNISSTLKTSVMEENEFYAIETVGSTGPGIIRKDGNVSHYMKNVDIDISDLTVGLSWSKSLLSFIDSNFSTLAFCKRWLHKLGYAKHRVALAELCNRNVVSAYPSLSDLPGSYTAQFEHTIVLRPTCKEVISRGTDY